MKLSYGEIVVLKTPKVRGLGRVGICTGVEGVILPEKVPYYGIKLLHQEWSVQPVKIEDFDVEETERIQKLSEYSR